MSLYNREELLKQTPICRYYKASKNGRLFFMHEFHQIEQSNEALFRMRRRLAVVDHLVELVEDYEHKGMKYYISEYIEQDLQALMDTKPGGVLDLAEALELYASLLKTLSQFHRQKVVLRVLQANKLRVKKGEVYFYDLSEAQTIKRKQKLFAENYFNSFIAPESFEEDGYSHEVDVWASGVLLFYLITRRFPFEVKNNKQSFEEEFNSKCANGFNFPQVFDKMGIKANSIIKNKFGLTELFRGIFELDPKNRKTIDGLMQNPLLKIYFQKGLMSKIIEHPESELFASIFHPKINRQKKSEEWAIFLHKEEILLDFIENSSSSLLNDSPDIFSEQLRYRTQLAVLKVALIKCNALIQIFYGRRPPFFPIDKQSWQKLRKSQTISWAKQKFEKKMKIFEELYTSACKHTSPKELAFLSAIPQQFEDIKSSFRHELSDMYKIGRQGLAENKSNRQLKRRLIENMVRVVILFLINRLFEEQHKTEDFSSYLKWSSRKDFSNLEDWIESEDQSVLREFVIKITNKYLKGSEE